MFTNASTKVLSTLWGNNKNPVFSLLFFYINPQDQVLASISRQNQAPDAL